MSYTFSQATGRTKRSEIRELLKWTRKPSVISFGGGLPDASLFPTEDFAAISREVLEKKGYLALQYGTTEGENEFLDAIAAHMVSFGDQVGRENLCVTTSSQQGLDLMAHIFISEGTPIILELPSYLGAIQTFQRSGADMHGIPMDENGIRLDLLEETLVQLQRQQRLPAFIYVIPDFQNPSGINMSVERRKGLLTLARRFDVPLIEDSPYREMNFSGTVLPSLWSLAEGKGVIQLKTFSKMLLPGMRVGWIAAEPEVIEQVVKVKQTTDLCTSSFNQLILASFLNQGKMRQVIDRAIGIYRPKKDAMVSALAKYMPRGVTWSKPDGGMFLWVVLPENLDSYDLFMTAIAHNVAYVTGRPFHCDGSGASTLRLNYSFPSLENIETGISFLGQAVAEHLDRKKA